MYPNKCHWLSFAGCCETQHNAGHRSPGGASVSGTASAVWTHHRGSSPGLDGGSSSPERWQVLPEESSGAAWWAAAAAGGGGGRSGPRPWRWGKGTWRWWHVCVHPCWMSRFHLELFRDESSEWASLRERSLHCQTSSWTDEPHGYVSLDFNSESFWKLQ